MLGKPGGADEHGGKYARVPRGASGRGTVENERVADPRVDFHQHLWPEPFIEALSRRAWPPRLRDSVLELADEPPAEVDLAAHELDARLALLDRDRIEVAVVSLSPALGIGQLPEAEALELAYAYEHGIREVEEATRGRIVGLGTGLGAEWEGFAGVCVAASAVTETSGLATLLDELDRRGGLLFVHPGPARPAPQRPHWWGEVVDYAAQMQAAHIFWLAEGADRWPQVRVVFAILAGGSPFQLERLRSRGIGIRETLLPNVYFDTASYGHRALELCLATFGVDCLVYGSDTPVIDSEPTLDAVRSFGDAVVEALCERNPARLLS